MNKNYTFKISVYSGDVVYALAGIKAVCERYKVKAEVYIWLGREWKDSIHGESHPYGVNEYALNMLKPLLESQPYIALCKAWEGEKVAVDLDELRTKTITTMPHGSIAHWYAQVWPDMHADVGRPWIKLNYNAFEHPNMEDMEAYYNATGKILINRTSRWRNNIIHYWNLRKVSDQLVFVGLKEEHQAFCKEWDLNVTHYQAPNFLALAIAIWSCKFFIGNQSLCFALAEAMKIPRILEVCPHAPNVIPVGGEAYHFIHQGNFEWLMEDLNVRL